MPNRFEVVIVQPMFFGHENAKKELGFLGLRIFRPALPSEAFNGLPVALSGGMGVNAKASGDGQMVSRPLLFLEAVCGRGPLEDRAAGCARGLAEYGPLWL